MPDDPAAPGGADARVLALFAEAGPIETPAPNVRAWLASDGTEDRRSVLVKRIPGTQNKARATQALALLHPNIVRTRRWIGEGGNLYVVRDVVRGKNLRQSLSTTGGTRPSPELIRRLLLPVLDALEYAHGRGATHGGLSPENILIADEGTVLVTDWATADPKGARHVGAYGGIASVRGDVKALGGVLSAYLPTIGPFASPAVRGRIEGVIGRCETVADLRETIRTLETIAAAPTGRATDTAARTQTAPVPSQRAADRGAQPFPQKTNDGPVLKAAPNLTTELEERKTRITQGGGGSATLIISNMGNAPLIIRMVATQHAWLNVRPTTELPLTLEPGKHGRIKFTISAARLSPGEYRSEVYLSANAGGTTAEDLRGGWFKHTSEVRITVEAGGGGNNSGGAGNPGAGLSYPANSPKVPPVAGCAGATGAALLLILLTLMAMGAGNAHLP